MMLDLFTPENLITLLTLTSMEVVLGIDNLVFLTIMVMKLPPEKQDFARRVGLFLALFMRLGLLMAIKWIMGLTKPLFTVLNLPFAGREIILLLGGLFLIAKSTHEMFAGLEGHDDPKTPGANASLPLVILQIIVIDLVFSLDSVITAVGMAQDIWIMAVAVVVSVGIMLLFSKSVGAFVSRHPSIKVLALSFLILIGTMLVAEATGQHINRGYIYFAMAFSLSVELLNMRLRKKSVPVHMHGPQEELDAMQGDKKAG